MFKVANIAGIIFGVCFSNVVMAETLHGPSTLSDRSISDLTIMGPATLSNITGDTLSVHGTLTARELTLKKSLTVKGPAICENSTIAEATINGPATFSEIKFDSLTINGPLEGKELTVNKTLQISGPLIAEGSQFHDIVVTSDVIQLKKCQIESINIKKNSSNVQVLTLTDDSTVNGNVTFESGKGKIVTDKSSKIKGKTIGATVEVQ